MSSETFSLDLIQAGAPSAMLEESTKHTSDRDSPEPSPSPQSPNEVEERKAFMQDLNKFMIESNKPLSKLPIMGYKELDLFQLFREVIAYGGFNEVVKNVGTWSKIWKRLGNFDPSITDSSFRLKKNYERYLLDYEYKKFPEHKLKGVESEKQLRRSSSGEFDSSSSPTLERKQNIVGGDQSPKKSKKNKRKNYNSFKEVVKESNGRAKMPLILGELVIENLGTIIPRSPYVTEKHIWPIGFKSSRFFSSMFNPDKRVKYVSTIIDLGDRPQFVVTAEDDLEHPIISPTPSGAWRTVLKRVIGKDDSRKNVSVSGALRFGLAHPVVANLIRELPEASNIPSPLLSRKRKSSSDESSNDSESEEVTVPVLSPKVQRIERPHESLANPVITYEQYFTTRNVEIHTREEMDDLESAVATLSSLRFFSTATYC